MVCYNEDLFESPIEKDFIHDLCKHLECGLIQQMWVRPEGKFYRLDLVLVDKHNKIAIELDGKQHDEVTDTIRDIAIIGNKLVDYIIRFKGTDVYFNTWDLLKVLFEKFPEFFDKERMQSGVDCLSKEVIDTKYYTEGVYKKKIITIKYQNEDEEVFDDGQNTYVPRTDTREITVKAITAISLNEYCEKLKSKKHFQESEAMELPI